MKPQRWPCFPVDQDVVFLSKVRHAKAWRAQSDGDSVFLFCCHEMSVQAQTFTTLAKFNFDNGDEPNSTLVEGAMEAGVDIRQILRLDSVIAASSTDRLGDVGICLCVRGEDTTAFCRFRYRLFSRMPNIKRLWPWIAVAAGMLGLTAVLVYLAFNQLASPPSGK